MTYAEKIMKQSRDYYYQRYLQERAEGEQLAQDLFYACLAAVCGWILAFVGLFV